MAYQLAQLNIGRLRYPKTDPRVKDFMDALEEINLLAEGSPGFIWRLKEDSGNATEIEVNNDPRIIVNMSVWESLEALKYYTYHSEHAGVLRRRREWFEPFPSAHLVMWWIPKGHIPSLAEGMVRLESLDKEGPSLAAFNFKNIFLPES